jgi:hypothetical protein
VVGGETLPPLTGVGVRVGVEVDGTAVEGTPVEVAAGVFVAVGVLVEGVPVVVAVAVGVVGVFVAVAVLVAVPVGSWPRAAGLPGATKAAIAMTAPAENAPAMARSLKSVRMG